MRTRQLATIACCAERPRRARELAEYLGWDTHAQESVHDLVCIYVDYGYRAFRASLAAEAPAIEKALCFCACHRGKADPQRCDCPSTCFGAMCLCPCHYCKYCDRADRWLRLGRKRAQCPHGASGTCGDCCTRLCLNACHYSDAFVACDFCAQQSGEDIATLGTFEATYAAWVDDGSCDCDCDDCSNGDCDICDDCGSCSCSCDCEDSDDYDDDEYSDDEDESDAYDFSDNTNCGCDCRDCAEDGCCDFCSDCGNCACCCCECDADDDDGYHDEMRGGAAARKAYIAETLEERLKRVAADIRGASGVDFRAELADDLDGDLVNAGAIESQRRVLVTRKAASCLSDDELAVIMGHEAGHIAHLDGSRAARFSTVSNALIQETVEDVDNYMKGRNAGPIARAAAKLGAGVLTAGATAIGGRVYRQMREYEADDAGIDFAAAANYDTEAGATALEKLDPRTDGPGVSYGSLLDTHPPRNERTARMRARARKKKN